MKKPANKPTVSLIGQDGNAFAVLGAVSKALREAGADQEYIDQYQKESTQGDYDHLLRTAMKYADVQ